MSLREQLASGWLVQTMVRGTCHTCYVGLDFTENSEGLNQTGGVKAHSGSADLFKAQHTTDLSMAPSNWLELCHMFGMMQQRGWGQALAQGRRKETIRMTRERERGRERRRRTGRERDDGHRDGSLEPRGRSTRLLCISSFGRQMISGLTCDMLS